MDMVAGAGLDAALRPQAGAGAQAGRRSTLRLPAGLWSAQPVRMGGRVV